MKRLLTALAVGVLLLPGSVFAQTIDASSLLPTVAIRFSPSSGTFIEGSTFQVPILLDTRGASVNTIELRIYFDPTKLSIVQPSSDRSIIGLWLEPPSYDNTAGTARYVGAIPNGFSNTIASAVDSLSGGITTSAGIIGTITFKAKSAGLASVTIRNDSEVLLNDGLGSPARVEAGRGTYSIVPKPPEGLIIFSETHPSQSLWSNNPNPVFAWERQAGVTAFSYVLDTKPNTIPESEAMTGDTTKAYEGLKDGLWYFHVKGLRDGVWGAAGHYLVRIDTTPPAKFKPKADYLLAAAVVVERALVSFFTTDGLSGIARYEVGVIDKGEEATESPVFIESQSPFQVPASSGAGSRVIVRAIDNAGNIQEASIDVSPPLLVGRFLEEHGMLLLVIVLILILLGSLLHYLYGHHVFAHAKRLLALLKKESASPIADTSVSASPDVPAVSATSPNTASPEQKR